MTFYSFDISDRFEKLGYSWELMPEEQETAELSTFKTEMQKDPSRIGGSERSSPV